MNGLHLVAVSAGLSDESWLSINRGDEGIDIILRMYAPDLEKMTTSKAPKAV